MSPTAPQTESFKVDKAVLAGLPVLSPSGWLTADTCVVLREALDAEGTGHAPRVVLDCRAVPAMDSAALELIVDYHEKLRAAGGDLRLASLNDVCADIMTVTRLVHVLSIFNSVAAALKGEGDS